MYGIALILTDGASSTNPPESQIVCTGYGGLNNNHFAYITTTPEGD